MKRGPASGAWARGGLPLLLLALALGLAFTGAAAAEADAQASAIMPRLLGPQTVLLRDLPAPSATSLTAARAAPAPRAPRIGARLPTRPSGFAAQANALDPSFTRDVPPRAAPAVSLLGFEGLDNNDNLAQLGFTVTPPDPQLAVGPNHVFEMVNLVGRIYTKTGALVQTVTLRSFFGVPAGGLDTDPKIIYDALSGRWFASYASFIDNAAGSDFGRLHLAVSQTNDPTGAWSIYAVQYTGVFPDYPGIGLTNDKFTVSSNLFDIDAPPGPPTPGCSPLSGFCGEQTIVFEKADLLSGVPAAALDFFAFPANPFRFTVRPAHSLSPFSDQFLATFDLFSINQLTVIRITGTPQTGNVAEAAAINLTVLPQDSPPPSLTAGGGSIDSGDFRLLEAIWRDGKLWGAASAACTPPGDGALRSCAHLSEVNTATNTVTQDIMFGAAGEYFSWPAVRTDVSGNLYASLTHTNPSIFAEARTAGRLATDPPNTMTGSALLRVGDVLHTSTRWGDYLGAAVDPAFPECVWLVGEYAKDTAGFDWGTFVAASSFNSGCDSDGDGRADSADNCPSVSNSDQKNTDAELALAGARRGTGNPPPPLPGDASGDACDEDDDNDDFTDTREQFVATNQLDNCAGPPGTGGDAWPADFNSDKVVNIVDVLALKPVFNSTGGDGTYVARKDLTADGAINIVDVLALKPVFNTSCG